MCCFLFFVLSFLAVGSLGDLTTPVAKNWEDMHVKHAWHAVPMDWQSLGPPPVGATIDLRFSLKPHDEDALIDALYEVSTPEHPKYGEHLSREQVDELVAPHPDTLELVKSWLSHHGVSSSISETHGNWLTLTGVPVSQANHLLGASFHLYQHTETNDTILRTISYALPKTLHSHVQTVVPTTYFGSPHGQVHTPRVRRSDAAGPPTEAASEEPVTELSNRDQDVIDPSYVRWLYKTMGYVPAKPYESVLGTVGVLGNSPGTNDLGLFMTEYRTDGADDAFFGVVQLAGGGYDPNNPTIEGNLNIQFGVSIAYPIPNIYYSVGTDWGDAIVSWLQFMLSQDDLPQTVVTTAGNYEQNVPLDHAKSVCILFARLGARGVSILFSSGNDGVGGGDCTPREGSSNAPVQFTPVFPASCPYVTAVGGTTRHTPEVAASLSGGGFSNHFQRPPYQVIGNVVEDFLNVLDTQHAGSYNAKGRGIPDISAQAVNYVTVYKGKLTYRDGTSCSTPTVGGIVALLNDYRKSKGKRGLGFLNPWLYGIGRPGFTDIISGSNPGCGTTGFPAIVGWDPVTGLGTPDFDKLTEIIDTMKN